MSDWSTVNLPSDPRRCEFCHEPKTGAAQADAWLKNPNRAACGSCHDNVNFATGENHVNLPQVNDNQCTQCHIPQGELEFDASITGAHTVPTQSATAPGHQSSTSPKIDNGAAGKTPTVTFTIKDNAGNGHHHGADDRRHQPHRPSCWPVRPPTTATPTSAPT